MSAFADQKLPLAVVAHPSRFENGGTTHIIESAIEIRSRGYIREWSRGNAEAAEERFFRKPILASTQGGGRRIDREAARQMLHHLDRHILEFVGSNIQAGGETIQGGKVGEIGAHKFGEVAD